MARNLKIVFNRIVGLKDKYRPVDDPVRAACGALPAEPSLGDRLLLDRKKDSR